MKLSYNFNKHNGFHVPHHNGARPDKLGTTAGQRWDKCVLDLCRLPRGELVHYLRIDEDPGRRMWR